MSYPSPIHHQPCFCFRLFYIIGAALNTLGSFIFLLAYRRGYSSHISSVVTVVGRPTAHTSSQLYYFCSLCVRVDMHIHRCIYVFSLLVLFQHISSLKSGVFNNRKEHTPLLFPTSTLVLFLPSGHFICWRPGVVLGRLSALPCRPRHPLVVT